MCSNAVETAKLIAKVVLLLEDVSCTQERAEQVPISYRDCPCRLDVCM